MDSEHIFREMLVEMNKCLQCDVVQAANGNIDFHLPFFPISHLLSLIFEVKNIFQNEPVLLNISSPIVVIGDLHGHFLDLVRILQIYGLPISKQLLFLGDFVDRGEFSIETVIYIYLLKYHFPENVKIIRGNHEFEYICSTSGFLNEIKSVYDEPQLFYAFMESFSYFPIAAIIDNSILAVHGGIGPSLNSIDQIKELERPLVEFGDDLLDSLLWSDPSCSSNSLGINQTLDSAIPISNSSKNPPAVLPNLNSGEFSPSPSLGKNPFGSTNNLNDPDADLLEGFHPSKRGSGHLFGKNVLKAFLEANHLTKLIRGHECVQDGALEAFDGLIMTVFSASNYCGTVNNKAAAVTIKDRNTFIVKRFPPIPYFRRLRAIFGSDEPQRMVRPRAQSISRVTNSSRPQHSLLQNEGVNVETIKSEGSIEQVPASSNNLNHRIQQQQQQQEQTENKEEVETTIKLRKKKPCSYSQLRMKAKSSRITSSALVQSSPSEPGHKPGHMPIPSILPNKNKKTLSPIFPHPNQMASPPLQKPIGQMRSGSGIVLKSNQAPKKHPLKDSPPTNPMKKKTVICPPMT